MHTNFEIVKYTIRCHLMTDMWLLCNGLNPLVSQRSPSPGISTSAWERWNVRGDIHSWGYFYKLRIVRKEYKIEQKEYDYHKHVDSSADNLGNLGFRTFVESNHLRTRSDLPFQQLMINFRINNWKLNNKNE